MGVAFLLQNPNERRLNMLVFLTAVIAVSTVAMVVLSFVIHRSSKQREKDIDKLVIVLATATLVSGSTLGESDLAIRLFNEQYPLLRKTLKI